MIERRAALLGLLAAPAIVRHTSLMRLARPRWYGIRIFGDNGTIGWYRVSQEVADGFANLPIQQRPWRIILPRWEACLRSGDSIIPHSDSRRLIAPTHSSQNFLVS